MEQNKKIPKGYRLKPETHDLIKKVQKVIKGNTDEALNFACKNILKQLKNSTKGDSVMKIFILVLVIAVSSMKVYSQWVVQQFNPDYSSVFFVPGTNTGYSAGQSVGIIRKSIDGGITWSNLTSGTLEIQNDIFFINQNTGWSVGNNGTILYTTNGGASFVSQTSGVTSTLFSVQFLDANIGYIATGSLGRVLKTTNAGTNWALVTSAGSSGLYASHFMTPNFGWVASLNGAVYLTVNGGTNWTAQTCTGASTINDIYFIDNQTGWCCASEKIFTTTNGGTAWVEQVSGTSNSLFSIFFYNSSNGIACGDLGSILRTTNGGTNWTPISSNTSATLLSISSLDANNILISGSNGYLLKSNNSGGNWNILYGSSSSNISSIYFISTSSGYALNHSGYLYRTSNGGINWNAALLPISNATDITFANASTGWIAGIFSALETGNDIPITLKTTNSGVNWTQYNPPAIFTSVVDMNFSGALNGWILGTSAALNSSGTTTNLCVTTNGGINWANPYNFNGIIIDLYFVSTTEGWACGDDGKVFKTNNGGSNWVQQTTPNNSDLYSIFFLNSSQGYACGGSGTIISTTNGGTTWNLLPSGTSLYLQSIHFGSATNGICVGELGVRLRTTNSGASWINSPESVQLQLNSAFMVSANNAYVAGDYGYISNFGGIVPIATNQNTVPSDFSLFQNYPNPFNPETRIKYQLPKNSIVKLSVFDITGRIVVELVNNSQNAGSYEIYFNASDLASGLYFYKLETNEFMETKKMIVIK